MVFISSITNLGENVVGLLICWPIIYAYCFIPSDVI